MAVFKIPESPTFNYLDLNNLQGMDSWDTNPNIMRSADMLNIVKKEGLHQVRHNIKQSFLVGNYGTPAEDDDLLYPIKYVGKIEEYDENGNTVPYYIKISEYLGEYQKENDSRLCISVWATPNVKNVQYDTTTIEGFENYRISYRFIPFTNYGVSGNRQGLYEHIQFDGKERVFTPIGILSFKCYTEDETETIDEVTTTYKRLKFDIENVLDDPYIPTVVYGSTPNGLDYTVYESVNLLTDKRKAQFLGDESSTQYHLPEKKLDDSYCRAWVMQSNGLFEEKTSGTDFNLNATTGVVTFVTAPGVSPVEGKDNVIIEYKKIPVTSSSNTINYAITAGDKLFDVDVTITKTIDTQDNTKTNLSITTIFSPGNNFDNTKYELTNGTMQFNLPGKTYSFDLATATIDDINDENDATEVHTVVVETSKVTDSFVWKGDFTATYTKINGGTTTVKDPGSVGAAVSLGTTSVKSTALNWIGLKISGTAVGTVGEELDGSDSYWTVTENVQLWINKSSALYCKAATLYGNIDTTEVEAGSTGDMYGYSTTYPSTPLSVNKKIAYSSGKTSVTLGGRIKFNPSVTLDGVTYYELNAQTTDISLPEITLPTMVTTEADITLTETGTASYSDMLVPAVEIIYDNIVPGSARLGCYYGAKCVTVFGYEADRRIFVSDGTNKDTYSGVTMDGKSSIYYFPDDNYNVLGEDTEILGYAQKYGYLLTFKRGEDSVYARYGAARDKDTVFPSSAVTRNLQILSRPIQINDEVLVVTRNGIKSISFVANEVRASLRSYFINNYFELSADYNYDKMSWFVDDSLLHIFLDNYEFTADLVSKSYVKEGANFGGTSTASTLDFQYEWYVSRYNWIDKRKAPQIVVYQPKDFERQTSGIVYDKQRPIGYSPEGVYEFFYDDYKVDVIQTISNNAVKNNYLPIKAHYITPFLNMGAINIAKTIKYVYVNTRSKNGDMFAIGYIDETGVTETIQKYYSNINDYETKFRNGAIPFPKLIQIKNKIRKFMNVKLYLQNQAEVDNIDSIEFEDVAHYGNMTFDRILVQYQVAGKYRGE